MATVVRNDHIKIDRLELGPFGTNAYVLACQLTSESVVVDAPGEVGKIVEGLQGTHPRYILMTHDHFDHVTALSELKSALNVPIAAHPADAIDLPVPADILLDQGEKISLGGLQLEVIHTPGHTPGSLCFLADNYLIAGDTLFPGGPGKTQSPADFRQIIESITQKIFKLPGHIQVYPGHGEAITVKEAKKQYEVFSTRPHDPDLCGDVVWDKSQSA